MLDARWHNYLLWLQERGLQPPTAVCKHCGYLPVAATDLTVCYPRTLSSDEESLMQRYASVWNKAQRLPLHNCKDNQLCTLQRRDLQRRKYVLLLGAESSKLLFNVLPRFASEHGRYRQHKNWGETQFLLTFHPRDILRYATNQLEWQYDITEAIRASRRL